MSADPTVDRAILAAEAAVANVLVVAHMRLWPDDERALKRALSVLNSIKKHT